MNRNVTYHRPVKAKVRVDLDNDEDPWEATPQDLAKFGLFYGYDAYMIWHDWIVDLLDKGGLLPDRDLTEAMINAIRYTVELAMTYPELLQHPDQEGIRSQIRMIETILRENEDRLDVVAD